MHALTFHGKERIEYETVPDPRIMAPTDAIVEVTSTAICGSDLHIYHERETGLDIGTVMGHEFVGTVVEPGPDVANFKKGDPVMSPFTTSCGECFFCRRGLTCRCIHGELFGWVAGGAGLHGAQAEYVRVPLADSTLRLIPDRMTREEALLLGDVFPTGYFCAEMAGAGPDGVCAVIGCGPVGLMAILGARHLGAERVFAVDSIERRLDLAGQFGAIPLNYRELDAAAAVRDETDGRGADAVLDVVGSAEAGRSAYELVRPGGTIAVVGVHTEKHMPFSPAEAYDKNITYRVGRCPARHYMDRLIPVIEKMEHDITSIISHRLPLAEGPAAYRMFDEKRDDCTKVVLKP
ncbi:MAG TPA: alcohol dehydrogenase family protein [Patescibacteria group bacterium]|nr:alcohol dehydrogenase family protein [Patescibacteria group bacterium]